MADEKVRITDLRNPIYTDKQRQILAHVSANPVTLSIEAVMDAAKVATGLSYFGEMDFLPRLEL